MARAESRGSMILLVRSGVREPEQQDRKPDIAGGGGGAGVGGGGEGKENRLAIALSANLSACLSVCLSEEGLWLKCCA